MIRGKRAALLVGVVLLVVLLSGCDVLGPGGYTISGTLTSISDPTFLTPITLTASDGSNSYTTQVTLSGITSMSYSISGVPAGSYSVVASFSSSSSPFGGESCDINGTPATITTVSTPAITGGSPYGVTETVSSVAISSSETIDITVTGGG